MKKPVVAILGATGAVGQEFIRLFEERNFQFASLKLLASARSAGKQVAFRGKMLTVEELTEKSFDGVDIALFSAGGGISLKFAPIAAAAGCVVIDNSSAFRLQDDVPLVVPEVNAAAAALASPARRQGALRGLQPGQGVVQRLCRLADVAFPPARACEGKADLRTF